MLPLQILAVPLQNATVEGSALLLLLVSLLLTVIQIAGAWAVFEKADHAGWKAIIPVYNLYVMLQIGENAWWWLVLLLVPVVNIYAVYKIHAGVARSFGRGIGFGLGLAFIGIVFFPLLGFGGYQYRQRGAGV
ncbi:signal peptidase I [Haloglomus irregulare]|jgi:hypothetical protein|uniref:Signal peptidase I n=1 Tax=Haloglomus irregulare TaxID=2234134 RepID=A0A554NFI6_9EURY|nr:DUF5684 domain-containing protein [Haloglomus irregulare]TSD16152.1 signal peptidase I [Haloglomus irregulare]